MTQELIEALERLGAPSRNFWENDLEMGLDDHLFFWRRESFPEEWVGQLKGRQVKVLCMNLELDGEGSVQHNKDTLRRREEELLPYFLVDRFSKYKSKVATFDYAKGVLSEDVLDICRIKDEDFDKTALLFAAYKRKPKDLRLIFHLDKIHKSGFARMKLKQSMRPPHEPFDKFLQPRNVKKILGEFDRSKNDRRTSELKSVVPHDSRYLVFIRRAERHNYVLRGDGVVHGYRPEWIILDFEDGAKRVKISSMSVSVPLEIANRLATGYYGRECEYENESDVTYSKQLERLLRTLKDGKDSVLTLVEIMVANSPLEGSPKIKITDQSSICNAVGHFEKAVGSILDEIEHIESIKVCFHKKRVPLILEKIDEDGDIYIVRYGDNALNHPERHLFEKHMRDTHGITVLSTEKRFKK